MDFMISFFSAKTAKNGAIKLTGKVGKTLTVTLTEEQINNPHNQMVPMEKAVLSVEGVLGVSNCIGRDIHGDNCYWLETRGKLEQAVYAKATAL